MPKVCREIQLPESIEDRRTLIRTLLGKDAIIKVKNLDTYFVGYISHPNPNKYDLTKHEDDTNVLYFGDHEMGRKKVPYDKLEILLLGPYIIE